MKKYFLSLLVLGVCFNACKKSDDDSPTDIEEIDPPADGTNIVVQNFLWQTLNAYYFWQEDVADLVDSKFSPQADYIDFLSQNPDPESFLRDKLLFSEDRFTFWSEDYKDLTNFLAGVSKSNGMEYFLTRPPEGGNKLIGVVRYIAKNSDASTKDIKRGDVFNAVDGVELFAEADAEGNITSSNLNLLDPDTYTLNMVTLQGEELVSNGKEITLTKVENFQEDPILVSNVLEVGDRKIAYLMYNQFQSGSGEELNDVFGDFIAAGATDLVLDLRYNGGGSGATASILASLIYGTNTQDLFFKIAYNDKVAALFEASDLEQNFVATTGAFNGNSDSALNTLNFNKVYILATSRSASASELVMVGLEPYLDVVHIGSTTVGKNQGSRTYVDDPENGNNYSPQREQFINPDNQWGIQPIISLVENSVGFSEYTNGLLPDLEFTETLRDLGTLGEADEPFLARAIEEITGISAKRSISKSNQFAPMPIIKEPSLQDPRRNKLILDHPIKSSKSAFLADE